MSAKVQPRERQRAASSSAVLAVTSSAPEALSDPPTATVELLELQYLYL